MALEACVVRRVVHESASLRSVRCLLAEEGDERLEGTGRIAAEQENSINRGRLWDEIHEKHDLHEYPDE